MNAAIYSIAIIIISAGTIGGTAAYLTEKSSANPVPNELRAASIQRQILLGIIASACVPLFLSLLKSQLVQSIFTVKAPDGKASLPPAYESYLIFIGICLIAAFSSRRFIDSVSKQILQRLDEVDEKATKATATAKVAKEVAQETAEEVESADNMAAGAIPAELETETDLDTTNKPEVPDSITPDERKILRALAKKTYRTSTGIAEDSGISRNRIYEMLEALADRKLALPTTSPRTGGARWIITKRGTAAVNQPS